MITPLYAGFECAQFPQGDWLDLTRHTHLTDMAQHYRDAITAGAAGFRDALTPGHSSPIRTRVARLVVPGVPVIWDLAHYRLPDAVPAVLGDGDGFTVLPVNEPMVESLWGMPWRDVVDAGIRMIDALPEARIVTCDPFHTLTPHEFQATDALVDTGRVNLVGINYYPHHAVAPLSDVLFAVHRRYRLPVAITETSWHEGHPDNDRWPTIHDRRGWLDYVQEAVIASGVPVEFCCWFPWLDTPPWDDPTATPWPSGWPAGQVAR